MSQTFDAWWYDYRISNGVRGSKRLKEIARLGWDAAARQNVPGGLEKACRAALEHTDELRDAWSRGAISDHDGLGARRSNRNVNVNVKLRTALDPITNNAKLDATYDPRCPHGY